MFILSDLWSIDEIRGKSLFFSHRWNALRCQIISAELLSRSEASEGEWRVFGMNGWMFVDMSATIVS